MSNINTEQESVTAGRRSIKQPISPYMSRIAVIKAQIEQLKRDDKIYHYSEIVKHLEAKISRCEYRIESCKNNKK